MPKGNRAAALTTDITLAGEASRSQCASARGASAAAVSKKKKGAHAVLGKLWGNGKGRFRTNGKYSSATVRGTIWLTTGSLRRDADDRQARHGERARPEAPEDDHRQGRAQLPGPRPALGRKGWPVDT